MKYALIILALLTAALCSAQPRFSWSQLPAGTAAGQIARTGTTPYNGSWVNGQAWVDSILYARGAVYGTGSAGYLAEWLNDSTLQADATGAYLTSVGTTAQRPTGAVGLYRYNSDEGELEFYGPNTAWWGVVRTSDYSLTSGSVPYVGSNGGLLESNSNFYWDATNNRLGIGNHSSVTSPTRSIYVARTGTSSETLMELRNMQPTSGSASFIIGNASNTIIYTIASPSSSNVFSMRNTAQSGSNRFFSMSPSGAFALVGIGNVPANTSSVDPYTVTVYPSNSGGVTKGLRVYNIDNNNRPGLWLNTRGDSTQFLIEGHRSGQNSRVNFKTSNTSVSMTPAGYSFDSKVTIGATQDAARMLDVEGEVRISDLTTDPPTLLVGADGDGDLNSVTVGSGLTLSGGSLTTAASYVDGSGSADRVATWADANTLTYGILHDDGATVGINTTPDATTLLWIQDTVTENSSWYGMGTELIFTPAVNAGASTEQVGNWIYIHPDASNTHTVSSLEGIQVTSQGMGSGNVTQIYGIRALASTSTTTTNLFGVYVDASVETGATATNRYILYLSNLSDGASPSGANYSLYNASSLASYFAGNVGIKTTGAAYALDMGSATGGARLPNGTTAQRPTGANGVMRYNSTTGYPEVYYNSTWNNFGGATTWLKPELEAGNDVNIASNNAGISITAMTNLELEGSDGGGGYAAYYIDHDGINRSITMELGGQDGNFSIIQLNDLGSADPELAGSIASILAQGASATYAAAVSLDSIGNVYVRTDGGDVFFYNYDDTKRDSAAHLMGIQEATGKLVPIAQVNAKYIEDTDLTLTAAEIYKFQEARVWMSTTAGATSQTELTIPDAAAVYLNTKIVVVSKDASGTYNNLINTPGSTMYDNGSDASSYVVAAGATVVLWCVQTGSSTYRWAIQQ